MSTILLATDGSPCAEQATATAIELAAETGWRLQVLSCWSMPATFGGAVPADTWQHVERATSAHAQDVVDAAIADARAAGIDAEGVVIQGNAPAAICDTAADATLVVVGAHGWGSIKRLVFGSVSNSVLQHAPCPVLVVRGDGPTAAEAAQLTQSDRRLSETKGK